MIMKEEDLLEPSVRAQIIQDIEGPENKNRKDIAYKRHRIMKDGTKEYVRAHLLKLLDQSTVQEMEYAISNVSIFKKIIDKLAKVYAGGVERSYDNDADNAALEGLANKIFATARMKTANKILKAHRNAGVYIKPVSRYEDGAEVWNPSWVAMAPYLYDVVEHPNDKTRPLALIFSNYDRPASYGDSQSVPERAARHADMASVIPMRGDGKDQSIADKKEDEGAGDKKRYIWWTKNYHFTTVGADIIDPATGMPFVEGMMEKIANPIERLPWVDLHIDQEGSYWAEGGEDLVDGTILINALISNAHHIGVTQGYGQLVVSGPNIPGTIRLGPNKMIGLPHQSTEEPAPTANFITANPPLGDLQNQIEMYIALMLTTNNLSTSGISASLAGGISAPSGIALAIDKAESLEDISDQRGIFLDAERDAWEITSAWLQYFSGANLLDDSYSELMIPDEAPMVEFKDQQVIMSEAEKLANFKTRLDSKLNTQLEIIMQDRKIGRAEAEKVLKEILEESLSKMDMFMGGGNQPDDGEDEPQQNNLVMNEDDQESEDEAAVEDSENESQQ